MKFSILDQTFDPKLKLPAAVEKIIAYLDKEKVGNLLPSTSLSQALSSISLSQTLSRRTVERFSTHPTLKKYRTEHPTRKMTLWGNKRTIAAFEKSCKGSRQKISNRN